MKSKITILFLLLFTFSCSSKAKEDPLLLPPGYGEVPSTEEIKDNSSTKKSDQDLQELRELLLKKNQ